MARTLNVQTPGEAPKATPADEDQNQLLQTAEVQSSGDVDIAALQARIAELEGQVAAKAKEAEDAKKQVAAEDKAYDRASDSISRQDRAKYLNMRADQVDPKKLVAAVLTKDGWVAPDQSGQKAKA